MFGKSNAISRVYNGAVLKIRALTGSTITFSKNGLNIISTKAYQYICEDNPLISIYYYFLQERVFGNIRVDISFQGELYSKEINILSNIVYDVKIPNLKLYIYKDGEEYTNITGGWSGAGWVNENDKTATRGTNTGSYLHCKGTNNISGVIATINKINLKYFSKIHYNGYRIKAVSSNNVCVQYSGLANSKAAKTSSMALELNVSGTGILDHDLNVNMPHSYYVVFCVGNSTSCEARANQIYLVLDDDDFLIP